MQRGDSSYNLNGWEFCASKRPISGAHALLALGRRLADPYSAGDAQVSPFCVHGATRSLKPCMCGSALVMGVRMHLPEAVFGANRLVLSHQASGFTLAFTAEGALRAWARDSVVGDATSYAKCAPAELPIWRQRMHAASMRTSTAVDWTFCCGDYGGEREEEADGGVDMYRISSGDVGASRDGKSASSAGEETCRSGCSAPNNLAPIMSGLIGLQTSRNGPKTASEARGGKGSGKGGGKGGGGKGGNGASASLGAWVGGKGGKPAHLMKFQAAREAQLGLVGGAGRPTGGGSKETRDPWAGRRAGL